MKKAKTYKYLEISNIFDNFVSSIISNKLLSSNNLDIPRHFFYMPKSI